MKLPAGVEKITLINRDASWIFPPIGFWEIEEANDGAGDNYGLYWELGKENDAPIICHKRHEEWSLVPEFPDLKAFLAWYEETNGQEGPWVNLNDTAFFLSLFNKARVLTKMEKTEEAIQRLEHSVAMFGEYSDSWTLLAANYYAINELDKAEHASLNAILTNYVFGVPSKKGIEQFNRINSNGKLKGNPLVKRKEGLLSGGDYTDPFSINYAKLSEAIAEFRSLSDFRSATLLEQNYGYMMNFEPHEIQAQYNFNKKEWLDTFKVQLLKYYPDRK